MVGGAGEASGLKTPALRRHESRHQHAPTFHVSRRQEDVDELVSAVIVARLTRPDLLELLAADSGDDGASAAATEAAEKQVRLDGFYDAAAAGELTRQRWPASRRNCYPRSRALVAGPFG